MRRSVLLVPAVLALALLTLTLVALPAAAGPLPEPPPPGPTLTPTPGIHDLVSQAVLEAVVAEREQVLGLLVNDLRVENVTISADGTWATALLVMVDPQSGEPVPSEPGLALARLEGSSWRVTLPAAPEWPTLVETAPEDLLSAEHKAVWLEMYRAELEARPTAALGGYLLPWAAGETRYLSRSVGHDADIPSGSAHYSFDFYVYRTMWRIYASKPGIVWRVKWDVPTCYEYTCSGSQPLGNYMVLQDTSTNPVTYQLYLHLAQDSIPAGLRQVGATVVQGQFIGMADNTGQSWGHHLHYQVHTNPNSYWGTAVDITFADVDINGGRPRVVGDKPYCRSSDVCTTFRTSYVSANVPAGDIYPPTGGITNPVTGGTAKTSSLHVEAWASDTGSGLDRAQLIAYYNGDWQPVGAVKRSSPFSVDWNMCAAGVPDGPVSLALQIWDREGNPAFNLPGLTHFTKSFDCSPPPPTCRPADNQIALFSEPDYGGTCVLLDSGPYPDSASLGALGDDNVAAIKVGAQALATLYTDANYAGRGETFISSDASLADNLVGSDTLTSLKVRPRANKPTPPATLVAPLQGTDFFAGSTVDLVWRDAGGGTQFKVQLDGPLGTKISDWLGAPQWRLEAYSLVPGTYFWKVKARNCNKPDCASGWSATASFDVVAGVAPPSGVSAPWQDDVEAGTNGWTATGLWNRLNDANRAHSPSFSWYYGDPVGRTYKDGKPNSGDLTSRPISIPQTGYVLRFWYRYQTEGPGRYWDQRLVQLSVDSGPFTTVLRLNDDAPNYWLTAAIDLSAYAGKTVRVRFHFAALDGAWNNYEGWYLDDISVAGPALANCSDNDNSPGKATLIQYGGSINSTTCPQGDVDYYKFSGAAGDRVVLDIDTPTSGAPSDQDLYLFLLDADGRSPLASDDDEIPNQLLDPLLGYTLRRTGTYFVKLRQWSHPGSGGPDYGYTLRLSKDNQSPSARFTTPVSGGFIDGNVNLSLAVQDNSGIGRVEFLYHSGDWLTSDWQKLGEDQDGSNGWGIGFDAGSQVEQTGIAFYANVFDLAGRWVGVGAWNVSIDRTAPTSALTPLATSQTSTALKLQWSGSDSVSGVDHFELQWRAGSGAWTDFSSRPGRSARNAWFVGAPGINYGFRLRAVDRAGNLEPYPTSAETSTAIPSAATLCTGADAWESGGGDNNAASAKLVIPGQPALIHNFCKSQSAGWLNDEDWVRFSVRPGRTYVLSGVPLSDHAATILELYAADGVTRLARAAASGFGNNAQIRWVSNRSGTVYLRVRHLDGRVIGTSVRYRLVVQTEHKQYLPAVRNRR